MTGISGIKIEMPTKAKVLFFTDNDLMTVGNIHFEINLVSRLLNQIYVVPALPPRYDYYDDPPEEAVREVTPSTSTGAATATATEPPFSFTVQ